MEYFIQNQLLQKYSKTYTENSGWVIEKLLRTYKLMILYLHNNIKHNKTKNNWGKLSTNKHKMGIYIKFTLSA